MQALFSGHGSEILLSVGLRQQLIDIAVGVTIDDAREDGQIRERVVPVGNSILLATDIESGDAPALCERYVA
jgi:hypothetical protein